MSVGNFFFPTKFWNWRKLKSIWWQWSRRWGSKFAIIDHESYYNVDIFGWQLLGLDDLCNIWCFWAWGMQLKFDPKLRNNSFFLLHFLCLKGKWWKERRGKKRGTIHALNHLYGDPTHHGSDPELPLSSLQHYLQMPISFLSLSHPHCIIFLFFSFLFLLLEHLKGLNFLCQLGRAGYDSISNREKDLVLADIICELGCMKLVDNHLSRICQNQLHKNMGAFNQVISKLIQYIIDMNCFQRVRNVILPC